MERRMILGVRKSRPIKRNKKSRLLKRVLDYLTSDSHMFAPLVSRPPSAVTSSIRGVEVKKPVGEKKKKKLLKNVGDYLRSNCYMYAPLLALPLSVTSPPRGSSSLYVEKVTTTYEVSKKKVIFKGLQDQASKGSLSEEIVKQSALVKHKETVKQMVPNSCRSSMPGRTVGKKQNVVVS